MPKYRILLVEELVLSDSGEFQVEAPTPEIAAAILIKAHEDARDADSNTVALPDGQEHEIEPENVVRGRVFCILVNDKGEDGDELTPDFDPAPQDAAPQASQEQPS